MVAGSGEMGRQVMTWGVRAKLSALQKNEGLLQLVYDIEAESG